MKLNGQIRLVSAEFGYTYLDIATAFTGSDGRLPPEYTSDGLHISNTGYRLWRDKIQNLVLVSSSR